MHNDAKILPNTFSFLYRLDPQPDNVIFLENGSTDDTLRVVNGYKRPHLVLQHEFLEEKGYGKIARIRQYLLDYVRQLDFDKVLWLDSDVFVKSIDMIDILASRPTDVTGANYLMVFNGHYASVATWRNMDGVNYEVRYADYPFKRFDTDVVSVGNGLLCVDRKVICDRNVYYHPLLTVNGITLGEDSSYCMRARQQHYTIGLDSTVRVAHFISLSRNAKKPWAGMVTPTPKES